MIDTWMYYVAAGYKFGAVAIGAVTYLNLDGKPWKERWKTTVISALAWPYVVYRHFRSEK